MYSENPHFLNQFKNLLKIAIARQHTLNAFAAN